ncbi:MAG: methionyl-tRNA formyltransferase [Planctomycetes bacterium RBG_16_64_10]|nr:MAG: methionyl-tRNA formyltransferase [Planctomycetes bacterium RBG_16_64_10]
MRLLMLGTGGFAVPTFGALLTTGHQLLGLVTRPTESAGGRSRPPANPMLQAAIAHGTPVWTPASVNSPTFQAHLATLAPDLLVVCDFGEILAPATLALARIGAINLHGSLLPRYRGAAPVAWAIYHGDRATGVTVIQMSAGVDAGPRLAQTRTVIQPEETAADLEVRLAQLGAPLVCTVIDQLAAGTAQAIAQDPQLATKAPRLKKSDGLIDWSRTASQIGNHIRAMQPWPTAYTFWHRRGAEPQRFIVHAATVRADADPAPGGTVLEAQRRLLVATGQGALELLRVQPAGKRVLSAAELLRGYPLQAGDRLGSG